MNTETKKTEANRIYYVIDKDGKERLVKRASKASVIEHVYAPVIRVATQNDLANLCGNGVQVEE